MYLQDDQLPVDVFKEPDDYYRPEPPPKFTDYKMLSGQDIHLRLVGHNPLWLGAIILLHITINSDKAFFQALGHLLWNGATFLSRHIERNVGLVKDKNVLEFGAGAGLPSLVSGILGAAKVVVTDYPDTDLIENLQYNIDHCSVLSNKKDLDGKTVVAAEPHLFGTDCRGLLSHLSTSKHPSTLFDTLILADLLFNHSEHAALITSVTKTLARTTDARALVYFAPYRPLLFHKDMAFFDLAKEGGLEVRKIEENVVEKDPFETERGDPLLRRTVFGYELTWTPEKIERKST